MKIREFKKPALSAVAFFWCVGVLSVGYSAFVSNYPATATAGTSQLSATEWNKMVTALQALDANLSNFRFTGDHVGIGGIAESNISLSVTAEGDGGPVPLLLRKFDNTNAMANGIGAGRARGTFNSPLPVETGDRFFSLIGSTYDGSSFNNNAAIQMWAAESQTPSAHGSYMTFETSGNWASVRTERMRLDSLGTVFMGTSTNPFSAQGWGNFWLVVGNTSGKNGVGIDASAGGASAVPLVLRTPSTTLQSFYSNTTGVGNITTNGSSTSYNTTSDYRLKENVVDLTGALDRISKLGVHRFDYKTNPKRTVDGFLAHELQTVVPEAVTGIKDAIDGNGNPVYQQVDYSKVVPLLSAGIKELKDEADSQNAEMAKAKEEIAALKAEIAALKSAR